VLASKLSTNAKFQNFQELNSRTFQGFSSTFKHLICFQALLRALKFLFQIQAFSRISQARYEPCAAERRVAINQYLLLAGPTAADMQQWNAAGEWDRQTDQCYTATQSVNKQRSLQQ